MTTGIMSKEERETANVWIQQAIKEEPPFSFCYNGITSDQLLKKWQVRRENISKGDAVLNRVIYKDTDTGLECILEITEYEDSPATEWLIRFRNTGAEDTPIIEDIQALDIVRHCSTPQPYVHYSKGTWAKIDDFTLQKQSLSQNSEIKMSATGGSPSRQFLPFFNLETGNDGVIIAIGWTGQWFCSFSHKENGDVAILAGMEGTHLKLHPNEEIRTPRILLLFWKDDILKGHNMLRRHIVKYHLPHPDGKEIEAPICNATWGGMKTENHIKTIEFIRDNRLNFDCYWIDAGWYGADHETEEFQNFYTEDWAYHIGHWRVNRSVHPEGLKPITEAAHAANMKVLLWFNPYSAVYGSPVTIEHPEWIMGDGIANGIGLNPQTVRYCSINIGIPEARRWITDLISDLITEHGFDYYRDDGSSCVLGYWRANDEPDRQGITEIRCVEGLYAFWDELIQRHPGLLVDNCGGGGSRIDLETISRSLVLHRTDYNCYPDADPIGAQVGTYGLSYWIPLVGCGTPARPGNTYNFRSAMSGGIPFSLFHGCGYGKASIGPIPDYPYEWHRTMISQYRRARDYYKGDFYPLTDCTLSTKDWLAYQMNRDDLGEGIVVAFRRPDSPYVTAEFLLKGLDIHAEYEIENADTGEICKISGKSLSEKGVSVTMHKAPESCLLFYKKLV